MSFQSPTSPYLVTNITESVKDFIVSNVVSLYNTQVSGTSYDNTLNMVLATPDDSSVVASVPMIVLDFPDDYGKPLSTGAADRLVNLYKDFWIRVYPGLLTDPSTGAQKPSVQSQSLLLGYFEGLKTALTFPINDYSTDPSTAAIDIAWIENMQIIKPKGNTFPALAIHKHRFDVKLQVRYTVQTLNG